jgi:3'-5' exoribonuclease
MNKTRRYCNQLMAGETIDQVFLVRAKDLRTAANGQMYITCALCDRTGSIQSRLWQASEGIFNSLPADGFVHVRGRTESYKGNLQLIIEALRPVKASAVEVEDFLAKTQFDVEKMWPELLEILGTIQDPWIKRLVAAFTDDPAIAESFKRAPAALQLHHPFIGGLLEHTLSLARACLAVLPLYPQVNRDLVLAGALLHDIGKIEELSADTAINYTDRGQLIGHITLGAVWTAQRAAQVAQQAGEPFPARTLDLLQHIILSHHGEYEYGSPRLPAIPEAFLLHYLDNLDAKLYMSLHAIASDPDATADFTQYHRQLETRIYKRSGQL